MAGSPKRMIPMSAVPAAPDVLWVGLLPPGTTGPQGELVQFRQVLPWK